LDEFFGTTEAKENGYEIWKIGCKSFQRAGSLQTAASELTKCNLDLVAVQEFR
jgi:hypothetical protein